MTASLTGLSFVMLQIAIMELRTALCQADAEQLPPVPFVWGAGTTVLKLKTGVNFGSVEVQPEPKSSEVTTPSVTVEVESAGEVKCAGGAEPSPRPRHKSFAEEFELAKKQVHRGNWNICPTPMFLKPEKVRDWRYMDRYIRLLYPPIFFVYVVTMVSSVELYDTGAKPWSYPNDCSMRV